ncbi:TPA: hypothetical protein RQM97_002076 [Aeromonas dhakensis]|uniref:hypothetical protein n=1 Tax=Aeromonas dhakensis TaxID=196024 RepID=UPI000299FECB|nr:hypothetical protein [Aeromonas dhakensis]AHV36707.1 hypothetical protein AI20_16410 [Aeromonas hydrophila YL17]BEJ51164.1 hypothetical protein Ri1_37630 [Aeromonas dhakensis]HDX8354094.1 hypothetical protein [Aeromonas dhakensis]HDZ8907728.1 hypothetical protein [Aeromonas dhakensis]
MDGNENIDVNKEKKEQVILLYGKCLLNLQQFELLLKRVLPALKMEGNIDTLEGNRKLDAQALSRRMLGQLISEFVNRMGESKNEPELDVKTDKLYIRFKFELGNIEEHCVRLRNLLGMRNELVHHFLERFPLNSDNNCEHALIHLAHISMRIEENHLAFRAMLKAFEEGRNYLYQLLSSDAGMSLLFGEELSESSDR